MRRSRDCERFARTQVRMQWKSKLQTFKPSNLSLTDYCRTYRKNIMKSDVITVLKSIWQTKIKERTTFTGASKPSWIMQKRWNTAKMTTSPHGRER